MSKGATYPLRLSRSVMRAAKEAAAREGVSLNQLIATTLAEKLSALRTEDLLAERAARGDWDRVQAILDRAGTICPVLSFCFFSTFKYLPPTRIIHFRL